MLSGKWSSSIYWNKKTVKLLKNIMVACLLAIALRIIMIFFFFLATLYRYLIHSVRFSVTVCNVTKKQKKKIIYCTIRIRVIGMKSFCSVRAGEGV